jgi:HAD superfamily hydrolase (TIGR01549 family)
MIRAGVAMGRRTIASGESAAPGRAGSAPGYVGCRPGAQGAVPPVDQPTGASAVVFDVGGVFTFPDWAVLQRDLNVVGPISVSALTCRRGHYRAVAALSRSQELGLPRPWESYYSAFATAIGATAPGHVDMVRTLFEEMDGRLWRDVAAGNVDIARRLARTGARIGILSNADGDVERSLVELGVCQVGCGSLLGVEFVIDSGVERIAKPDPRIFRLASDRLGVDPGDVLYVGDNLWLDVVGARRAGLRSVLLDPLHLHPAVPSRIDSLAALVEEG